jgi:hypothetical protein
MMAVGALKTGGLRKAMMKKDDTLGLLPPLAPKHGRQMCVLQMEH